MTSITNDPIYRLVWLPINESDSVFEIYYNNHKLLTKNIYGDIISRNGSQTNKVFKFLSFNGETCEDAFFDDNYLFDFIDCLKLNRSFRYCFVISLGVEAFDYNSEKQQFTFEISNDDTPNMNFMIKMTEDMRMQFANELTKFRTFYKQYLQNSQN